MSGIPLRKPLFGRVKSILSGDTLILQKTAASNGPPPEIRLFLSGIRAPHLNTSGTDENGAWESREYLRKRLIGNVVCFEAFEKRGDRIYGEVYEKKEGEGLRVAVVREGWAKAEEEELKGLEETAKRDRKGIWGEAPEGRRLKGMMSAKEFVGKFGGNKIKGIVEYVANGSTVKVYFGRKELGGDTDYAGMIAMAGVQCPGFRRPEGKNTDGSLPQPEPLPFALNGRYLTEVALLQRDVVVKIANAERNGLLFGDVRLLGNKDHSMAVDLLKRGFAKTVGWSLEFADNAPALRTAERQARDARIAMWKDYVAQNTVGENERFFTGKVVEVISGDMIAVLVDGQEPTAEPKRISLASVRATRINRGAGGSRAEMFAGNGYLAKEALRKSLIGRRVNVKVEYIRQPGENAIRKAPMTFATVERLSDSNKKTDVALALISTGMLTVIRHRGDEERAENYEEYLEREKKAIEDKVGVHKVSGQETGPPRINDLTMPDSKRRAESMLREMTKANPHKGIVEYVSTASRYRIYFPKKAMLITLALKAIRSPQPSRKTYLPDGTVQEEKRGEPNGDDALAFAREHYMQRDVEVFVSAVDRIGSFLGGMRSVNSREAAQDASHGILEAGYGYLHEAFDPCREPGGNQLIAAEKTAKDAKRGLWLDYMDESTTTTLNGHANGVDKVQHGSLEGKVCEVGMGGVLYVQTREGVTFLNTIEKGLAAIDLDNQPPAGIGSVKTCVMVCAKFTDGKWYRAQVLHKESGKARVHFVDYGNDAWVEAKDIRTMPSASWAARPQAAIRVTISDIKVAGEDEEAAMEAGQFLYEQAYGQNVTVKISKKTKDVIEGVVTVTRGGKKIDLRQALLEGGVARVLRKSGKEGRDLLTKYGTFEDVGKKKRLGLWRHGDPYASDEDDDELTKERNKRRYG